MPANQVTTPDHGLFTQGAPVTAWTGPHRAAGQLRGELHPRRPRPGQPRAGRRADDITVEAQDNGGGFPAHTDGVGVELRSMAERAEELGGSFSAANDLQGAVVRAVFPARWPTLRRAGPARPGSQLPARSTSLRPPARARPARALRCAAPPCSACWASSRPG